MRVGHPAINIVYFYDTTHVDSFERLYQRQGVAPVLTFDK